MRAPSTSRSQDLNALTLDQVRAFHTRFYGARFAQFGAAGDIDVPALQRALQAGFGDWNAGEPFTRVPQPLLQPPRARRCC